MVLVWNGGHFLEGTGFKFLEMEDVNTELERLDLMRTMMNGKYVIYIYIPGLRT